MALRKHGDHDDTHTQFGMEKWSPKKLSDLRRTLAARTRYCCDLGDTRLHVHLESKALLSIEVVAR